MSLEAIAALLGHRSPRMTLVYARISNDTLAEQYFAATEMVEMVSARPTSTMMPGRSRTNTSACSQTVAVSDRPSSTAPIKQSARAAGSSRPVPSSSRSCVAKPDASEQADFEGTVYQELIDGSPPTSPSAQSPLSPPHRDRQRNTAPHISPTALGGTLHLADNTVKAGYLESVRI